MQQKQTETLGGTNQKSSFETKQKTKIDRRFIGCRMPYFNFSFEKHWQMQGIGNCSEQARGPGFQDVHHRENTSNRSTLDKVFHDFKIPQP